MQSRGRVVFVSKCYLGSFIQSTVRHFRAGFQYMNEFQVNK
ncbi:hypothetical protein YPPY101_2855 [Yersinia pestis PY-101]|nr:hypothetical protein YPPY25_2942 [Yersinia pestis PY-25]EIS16656.1 hypothetical protein YPPY52_2981 [Yersinia pestis PY-52]EIS75909.1 hypothetical protein YPPY71_2731 [Yersinia pestis PY-71]EIT13335.1 hypothetical protein YPPY93_2935 [Yersinia pestis PY-93]EIT44946.1 hypothetical protein YPPY101_2855 [Yersinia pestis PY-101]EIT56623.1 hypothetical protein YPPY103_3076 [Yersinia pestis PY-103]